MVEAVLVSAASLVACIAFVCDKVPIRLNSLTRVHVADGGLTSAECLGEALPKAVRQVPDTIGWPSIIDINV